MQKNKVIHVHGYLGYGNLGDDLMLQGFVNLISNIENDNHYVILGNKHVKLIGNDSQHLLEYLDYTLNWFQRRRILKAFKKGCQKT